MPRAHAENGANALEELGVCIWDIYEKSSSVKDPKNAFKISHSNKQRYFSARLLFCEAITRSYFGLSRLILTKTKQLERRPITADAQKGRNCESKNISTNVFRS